MPKRFLVTGGCGFIGSHLVDHLCNSECNVIVIDSLSTGSKNNIEKIGRLENFIERKVEEVDLLTLGKFDGVFHLAAQASVPVSIENLFLSSSTNLLSSLKVIDFCSLNNIPLIYASSSAVYGNLPVGDENSNTDLISPYAADKLMLEIYCDVAHKLYGLRSFGHRFFNVYGPKQDPSNPYSGVISIFSDQILKENPITIFGGHQTRDFVYVKDVVEGLLASYHYILHNPVSTFSNLLTGKSTSINNLAEKLMQITGKTVPKIYKQLPNGDPEKSIGKIETMNEKLDLAQFVSLDDGLKQVINWMKDFNG